MRPSSFFARIVAPGASAGWISGVDESGGSRASQQRQMSGRAATPTAGAAAPPSACLGRCLRAELARQPVCNSAAAPLARLQPPAAQQRTLSCGHEFADGLHFPGAASGDCCDELNVAVELAGHVNQRSQTPSLRTCRPGHRRSARVADAGRPAGGGRCAVAMSFTSLQPRQHACVPVVHYMPGEQQSVGQSVILCWRRS